MKKIAMLGALMISGASAGGAPLDWAKTNDELSALSQLGAGYAWAYICNRTVNTEAAGRFLEKKLGQARVYSAAAIADMMLVTVGSVGFEKSVGGGARECSDAVKNFGPRGAVIPGLIE